MKAIRVAGSGGQGVQLAAVILAEAAIRAGWHVACTQTYGPESRGGASRADVLISQDEIDYPKARELDVLVALSAEGCERNVAALRTGGVLICDRSVLQEPPAGVTTYALPIVDTAREIGGALSANVVALGVVCAVTEVVSRENLGAALSARIRSAISRNQRALEAGLRLGAQVAPRRAQSAVGGPP